MGKKSLGKKVGIIIFILIFCITNVSYNVKAVTTYTIDSSWVTIYQDAGNIKTSNPSIDTTGKAINDIINYFIDNGQKKIYIENGTYNMSDSIIIDQNYVSIVGESNTNTILKQINSGAKSIVIKESNIIVSNLQIDASGGQEAIQAQNGGAVHDITIDSCVIVGSRMSPAIRFYGESSSNKNSNNYIQGNKIYSPTGVDAGSSPEGAIVFYWQKDAIIKDNIIEGSMLNVFQCEKLEINHNTIKDTETERGISVTLLGNDIKILNNTIDNTKKSGIAVVVDNNSATERYSGIQIYKNNITNSQYFGIEARNLKDSEISYNTISEVYSQGIYLLFSDRVNTAHNSISNFGINRSASGWPDNYTGGIFLDNDVKDSIIQENTIDNDDAYPCPAGIMIHDSFGANNNKIINNIVVGNFTEGIHANGTTDENTSITTARPDITTVVADTSIILNWIPIDGVIEYEVEIDGVLQTPTIKDVKYIDGGLPANVTHKYRVRMRYGEWSAEITATNKKPQNITTLSTENSITLNWDKVKVDATNEIADYDVYLVDENKIVHVTNGTQYIHNGLSSGTTYRYKVRAKNGSWSDEITAKTKISAPVLSLGAVTENSIEVNWNVVAGATGYYIQVDGSSTLIDVGTSTTYKFTGLSSNTSHSYIIKVKDDNIWSNSVAAVTKKISSPILSVGDITENSIEINWNGVAGATGYCIQVDGSSALIDVGSSITYKFTGLSSNTSHSYIIKVKDDNVWSNSVVAVTKKISSPVLSLGSITDNSIEINWNEVDGATGYYIEVDGSTSLIDVGGSTTHKFTGLSSNTSHSYRIKVKDDDIWSNLVTAKTKISSPTLSLGMVTENSIEINWNGVAGATGYYIQVDGSSTLIDVGTSTTYKFTGLSSNTSHSYIIKVKDDNIWSNLVTVKTSISSPVLSLGMVTENSIELNWNGVAGATGYYIEVDGSTSLIDVGTSTNYKFIGLGSNSMHVYRIKVRDNNAWSNTVSATTSKLLLPLLSLGAVTESSIELNWTRIIGSTGYYIEVDGSTALIDAGMNTSYKFMGLRSNATHSYKVKEKDKNVWSNVVTATTLVQQVLNPPIVPQTTSSGAQVVIQPEKPVVNTTTSPAVVPVVPKPSNRPKSSSSGKKKRDEDRTLEFSFESYKTLLYEENLINDKDENKLQKILSYAFRQDYWLNLRASNRDGEIVSYQFKMSLFPYNLFSQNELNNILVNKNENINTIMVRDYTNFKNVDDKSEISEYSIVDKYILSVKDQGISIQRR